MSTRIPIAERYWSKVHVRGPDECWPWTGTCRKFPNHPELRGYGLFWDGTRRENGSARMVDAHRFGYMLRVGGIADNQEVCHKCDFRPCQNDAHWWLGTGSQNMRDAVAKGRLILPDNSGEKHGMSKLTRADIADIRSRWLRTSIRQSQLAAEFGISQQQVSRIVRSKSWR